MFYFYLFMILVIHHVRRGTLLFVSSLINLWAHDNVD